MASRRAFAAALAALPFARPASAATIPDIHALNPFGMSINERFGSIKQAGVVWPEGAVASLVGKTYGFYGTPLVCTQEVTENTGGLHVAVFEEINL